jgi:medium-chain acyl-[acyl-carrier-protein] hydrolase
MARASHGNTGVRSGEWHAPLRSDRQARVRLICFPYAGGGASAFRGWSALFPPAVEVVPVHLPGRDNRFKEPPFATLPQLIDALAHGLSQILDLPFALLGHSMGALIAFELARRMRRDGIRAPLCLFVSGRGSPRSPRRGQPLHTAPPDVLIHALHRLNGTPEAILQNAEVMEVLIPLLRADFALSETYEYVVDSPLECPISALGGLDDAGTDREVLQAWHEETVGGFRWRLLPGDHFFLHSARSQLVEAVYSDLCLLLESGG